MFEALTAAMRGTGPAILPLAPDLPAARMRTLLDVLRPSEVETAQDRTRRPNGIPVDAGTAVVIATSGSTGAPKGVELGAAALESSARAGLDRLGARPGDRWVACLPTHHVAGIQVLVRSLVNGTEPALHEHFDARAVATAEAEYVAVVPTMLQRLLDAGVDLTRFRALLLGGAAPSPALLERARTVGARVVTTYGMSETCGGCVYDGVPFEGVDVGLAADGRIRIAGPVLFDGYRLRPDLTAAAMDGEWFVTNDLGRFDDGRLRVRGRADDVIVSGGENVIAGEVGALLGTHPAVHDVVVVGRPDREWGERVTAVVVPADVAAPPTLEELRSFVRSRAPVALAPQELEVVEAIPLLPSGKPDRATLRGGSTD